MPLGSEERFAKIFRASPTPMAIVALDGRHLDVNESWLRTFGYTREEVVAKTPAELGLFLVRSEETYGVLHEIARSQSLDDVEMVLRTSAGIERIGLVSIQLIDLEGETCALSTFVDITERKRAERRARTQYAITRLLAESSALDHAIPRLLETIGRGFEWDAAELWQEDPASGRLACAGTWAREIPGFPDLSAGRTFARGEGLPGKVWADAEPLWMPDVSVDPRFLRGSAAARAGLRSAFAVPIRSDRLVGGVMVFFGRAIRPPDEDLILTMADLGLQIGHFTERRRAEDALAKTTVQYERLVHSIDGIVWEADAQSFRFTFVSSKAERLLGYPVARWRDDVAFWRDHIHPDDRDRTVALCVEATRQLRDHEFDYRMIAADGRSVWLHDVVTVVVEDGRAVKLRGVMVDITARKQVEAEREQLLIREQEARREAEAARNRLAFLVRATGVLASSLEYRATLSNVVRVAIPQLADGAAFYLFGEGG
jgi:PAS domain S-box-containing protein